MPLRILKLGYSLLLCLLVQVTFAQKAEEQDSVTVKDRKPDSLKVKFYPRSFRVGTDLLSILKIILWMILVVALVRFLNVLIFNTVLRSSQHEISNLVRNVLSIIIFIAAFFVVLQSQYSSAYEKLTPIFTGSTIIAVVLGLALQDTLGNLFAGIALQADQPFQIGDVISGNHECSR